MTLKTAEITSLRLRNQRLSTTSFNTPTEAVAWLGASQAQDYAGAKWALGLRMQNTRDEVIESAVADGSILRTHVLRPTWHFVSPADIRWMLALSGPRVHALNAYMYRRLELDRPTLDHSQAVLAAALQGGNQLTRDDLLDVLKNAGLVGGLGLRLTLLLMAAELDGVICSGARRGKQFTYALLDERAPQTQPLERKEALAQLAERFFRSRGPATLQDFAKWSSFSVSDCRRGLEAVKGGLEQTTLDRQTYWFSPDLPSVEEGAPAAHLLSIFDELISSYRNHDAIADAEMQARLRALGNDLTYIILVDGRVCGTWKKAVRKNAVTIQTRLFRELTAAETEAVEAAAQRYGRFLGLPVILENRIG